MAELKNSRNSFEFRGKAIITDKTFTIDKVNEAGTWQYNSLNFGIDCGDDGIHYVSLMGGFNPNGDNYIYVNMLDENGRFANEQQKIAWEDRFNITSKMSQLNMIKLAINPENNYAKETYLHAYDAIKKIQEYLKNDMLISVNGQIDFMPDTDSTGTVTWKPQFRVEGIYARKSEGFVPFTSLRIVSLIDKETIGKPNFEDKTIPLYIKTAHYVNKVGKNKYNQVCLVPLKILWNIKNYENQPKGAELLKTAKEQIFTPSDEKFADELILKCRYTGGVQTVKPTIDDLPQQLKTFIALGVLTEEQALSGEAVKNTIPSELEFVTLATTQDENTKELKLARYPKKYALTEYKFFEDLTPIENSFASSTSSTNSSKTISNSEDFDSKGDIDDLFKLFAE